MSAAPVGLDQHETDELAQAEEVIGRGLKMFVEVGKAFAQVRDGRLYRDQYATFEDYCRHQWGLDRVAAHRHIDAANAVLSMDNIDPEAPKPSNLRQARELAGLDPKEAAATMRRAHEATNGKLTAQAINTARLSLVPEPEKTDPRSTPVAERASLIAELAAAGYSGQQIAERLGYSRVDQLRRFARNHDIVIPADVALGKARRPNSRRITVETVGALEGLATGVELVDYADLDPNEATECHESLARSLRILNRFAKRLKETAR